MPSYKSRKRRELAKAVAARKRALEWGPQRDAQNALSRTLNLLNAYGVLEKVQQNPPGRTLAYGPKAVTSGRDEAVYAGVVIWLRRPGYHNYDTLTLLGLWASGDVQTPHIIAGTRTLKYGGLPYNPESYFRNLSKDFSVYYGKSAPPPTEPARIYAATYDPDKRLEMRQAIAKAITQWMR